MENTNHLERLPSAWQALFYLFRYLVLAKQTLKSFVFQGFLPLDGGANRNVEKGVQWTNTFGFKRHVLLIEKYKVQYI